MTNSLSAARIDDLRDYTARKLESLTENTQHPAQDQARHHAETILALIAERESWSRDLRTKLRDPRTSRADLVLLAYRQETENQGLRIDRDLLTRENAALIAERGRLLADLAMYERFHAAHAAVKKHFEDRFAAADENGMLTRAQFDEFSDALHRLVKEKTEATAAFDAWKAAR